MKVKAGDTVWFHKYGNSIHSGTVISILNRGGFDSGQTACIQSDDEFISLEVNPSKLFLTRQEATLSLAEYKQQQASKLLSEAASLFKTAGAMKEDIVEG